MLLADLDDRIKRLERLLEVSRRLSSFNELYPLLQFIVDVAGELTRSQACSILLYAPESGLFKFVASPSVHREALQHIQVPVDKSVAGLAFTQSKPIVIQYARYDPRVYRGVDYNLDFETQSILAAPLIFHGETIGVFEAVNKMAAGDGAEFAHYTEEDVAIIEGLASQAALAIHSDRMLRQAQHAYDELTELERLKKNFIAITSHELRTPVGIILGHATDLRDTTADEGQCHQLDLIVNSANRLRKIIEDLDQVDEIRQEPTGLLRKRVAIASLIREVTSNFQDFARHKKITLAAEVLDADLAVEGDAEKINIALSNLVKNAITFTAEDGHVTVSADKLPGYVKISVVDDGIGIPMKDLHRIFERFYQVESHMTRKHGGMGLGLAVAKTMIEMHGGQIWVESKEEEGSTFSFLLPISSTQAEVARRVFLP